MLSSLPSSAWTTCILSTVCCSCLLEVADAPRVAERRVLLMGEPQQAGARLDLILANDTQERIELEGDCERWRCRSVRVDVLSDDGEWAVTEATATSNASLGPGQTGRLSLGAGSEVWSPGMYRVVVPLRAQADDDGVDVIREFAIDGWSAEFVRQGLDLLEDMDTRCFYRDERWRTVFDRASAELLFELRDDPKYSESIVAILTARGGHDEYLSIVSWTAPLSVVRAAYFAIRDPKRRQPLVTRLVARLAAAVADFQHPLSASDYYAVVTASEFWPAGMRETLFQRFAQLHDHEEVEAMMMQVFRAGYAFEGYGRRILRLIRKPCHEPSAAAVLATACNDMLALYTPARHELDLDGIGALSDVFRCGTRGGGVQCPEIDERWEALGRRAGEGAVHWLSGGAFARVPVPGPSQDDAQVTLSDR